MDDLVALCKRRGFIFPSCQIYGGLQGLYDYGPLGVELKNNLKQTWWQELVHNRDDIEGLDSSIITSRAVLHHSGHEATFTDPLIDCKTCKARWRADFLINNKCLGCGSSDLTAPRDFNLMFKTNIGPIQDENATAYLRPETAQGIFINFKNILDSLSPKLPFGIAQIGKAFRNEITPRNFIFRVREFEQMELEFFVQPGEDEQWHQYWVNERLNWWKKQGLASQNLVCSAQAKEELAHYSKATVDILYRFPHGVEELEGIANRTDYDLGSHTKNPEQFNIQAKVTPNKDSTQKLVVQNPDTKEWFVPFVIEPSAGVDRGVLAVLAASYHEETLANTENRIVLKLRPHLAPVKLAVIPLAKNKPTLVEYATNMCKTLKREISGKICLENSGNIGKNYRRHDEIGTPACVTIDFETVGDENNPHTKDTVTVRDRDSLQQIRIAADNLAKYLNDTYFKTMDI